MKKGGLDGEEVLLVEEDLGENQEDFLGVLLEAVAPLEGSFGGGGASR